MANIAAIQAAIDFAGKSSNSASNALDKTNTTLEKTISLISEINNMTAKTTTTITKFTLKAAGISTAFNKLDNTLDTLKNKFAETFSTENLKNFVSECLEVGSALTEVQNVIDTVFKENADSMNEWSNSLQTNYGLTELASKRAASTFGGMLSSTTLTTDQITKMSKSIAQLSADFSSFYDKDFDDITVKFRSMFSGEITPLRELGYDLSVATMQQYMLKKGINATWKELDQASKQILRYNYVVENSAHVQGDYAKTFTSWSNQIRTVQVRFEAIKTTLGQSFINIFSGALQVVNQLMIHIQKLADSFENLTEKVFKKTDTGGTQAANNIADAFNEASSEIQKSMSRTTSSFDEFHKLNDNSNNSNNKIELGLELADINTKEADTKKTKYQKWIDDLIEDIKKAWKTADFTEIGKSLGKSINNALSWLQGKWSVIFTNAEKIGKSLATFLNGIFSATDFTKAGETFRNSILTYLTVINSFFKNFDFKGLGKKISDGLESFFKRGKQGSTFLDLLAQNIALALNGISDTINEFANNTNFNEIGQKINNAFKTLITDFDPKKFGSAIRKSVISIAKVFINAFNVHTFKELGKKIGATLKEIISRDLDGNTIFSSIGKAVSNGINSIISAISELLNTPNLIDNLKQGFSDLFANINIDWTALLSNIEILADIFKDFVKKAVDSVPWGQIALTAITLLSDAIKAGNKIITASFATLLVSSIAANPVVNFVVHAFQELGNAVRGFWNSVFDLFSVVIIPKFKYETENLVSLFRTAWTGIKLIWQNAPSWFNTIVSKIHDKFKDIAVKIGETITGTIKAAINAVLDNIETKINTFIDSINGVGSFINKLTGSDFTSISHIDVPHLAQGGYVRANMPQLAVIGDNKTQGEIVAPENKIVECVSTALQQYFGGAFINNLSNSIATAVAHSAAQGTITVPIMLDGYEIARVITDIQNVNNSRGVM